MYLLTTEFIPGEEIQALGLVKGSTIQTVNAFKDIGASFKTIVGGELRNYTQMMDEARRIATDRMVFEAQSLGADAIVGVRYATSAIMASAAEVMAYGTAVKIINR
ncbi:MAG: YbjQ family protein [Ruminiclostridium sp.]|nr:YbjQ family protein [Ruminiclostridium sp.]